MTERTMMSALRWHMGLWHATQDHAQQCV